MGSYSWYELARVIFELAGMDIMAIPVPSSECLLPAVRPAKGVFVYHGESRVAALERGADGLFRGELKSRSGSV